MQCNEKHRDFGKSRCLAPPARLELTTLRLGGARSIQVSYGGLLPVILTKKWITVKAED